MMKLKEKKWIWKLTWPFAHDNYTTLGNSIYHPKGKIPSSRIIKHEEIHLAQKKDHGRFKFTFKYLFCLPLFWNKFRYLVEYDAYKKAQSYSDETIHKILSGSSYGWLRKPKEIK